MESNGNQDNIKSRQKNEKHFALQPRASAAKVGIWLEFTKRRHTLAVSKRRNYMPPYKPNFIYNTITKTLHLTVAYLRFSFFENGLRKSFFLPFYTKT